MSFASVHQETQHMMPGLDHPENSDSVWISRDMEQSYAQPSLDLHGQAVVDPRLAPGSSSMTWPAFPATTPSAAPPASAYPSLQTNLWDVKVRRAPFGGSSMPTRPLPQTINPALTYNWMDDVAGPWHTWEDIYRARAQRGIDPYDPILPQRPAPAVTPPPKAIPSGNGETSEGSIYFQPASVTHVWPSALTWSQNVSDKSGTQNASRSRPIVSMLTDGSPLHLVSSVGGISFSSAFAYHGDDTLLSPASTAFTHVQTPLSSAYNPSNSEAADSDYVAASEPIFPNTAIRKSKRIMTRTKCSKAAKPLPTKSKSKHARHPRPASTARSTSDSEGTSSYGSFPFACPHCKRRFARKYDMSRHVRQHTGESPYQCPACSERFVRNDRLRRHLASSPHCAKKAPSTELYAYGVTGPRLKSEREKMLSYASAKREQA